MLVEVVYGNVQNQNLITLDMAEGSTVQQALEQSNLLNLHPELKSAELSVGIFSQRCELTSCLKTGDRVEIYQPLFIDPKTARRLRQQKTQAKKS